MIVCMAWAVGCSDSPEPAPVAPAVARAPLVEPVPVAVTVVEFEPLPVLDPETGPVVAGRPWSDWQRLLDDPDSYTRYRALIDLYDAGPAAKHAADAIRKRLRDNDPRVRGAAVTAISKIAPGTAMADLIARLGDDNIDVRTAALYAMGHAGAAAEPAVPMLSKWLDASDAPLRHEILFVLSKIGPKAASAADDILRWATEPEDDRSFAYDALRAVAPVAKRVVDELTRRLCDKDPVVRRRAAEALGAIGAPAATAVPTLIRLLGDDNENVRSAAARALGGVGPTARAALPVLLQHLADPTSPLISGLCWAFVGIDPSGASWREPVLASIFSERDYLDVEDPRQCLAESGRNTAEWAMRELRPAMRSTMRDVRNWAVSAMGELAKRQPDATVAAIPELAACLSDSDDAVRWQAAHALLQLGAKAAPAAAELTAAVSDSDRSTAYWAAQSLAEIGPSARGAVPALAAALRHPDESVREEAAKALGGIRSSPATAVPALTVALSDKNAAVRSATARALGEFGSEAAGSTAALLTALTDKDVNVRGAAARGLGLVAPNAPDVARALIRASVDEDGYVVDHALEALARAEPTREIIAALVTALGHDASRGHSAVDLGLTKAGPRAVPALATTAWGNGPNCNRAIRLLSQFGAAGVPPLIVALRRREVDVRWLAAESLSRIGPAAAPAVAALTEALESDDAYFRRIVLQALGAIGPASAPSVAKMIRLLADPESRPHAIEALGGIGPAAADAVRPLTAVLRDRHHDNRIAALKTLGRIGPAAAGASPAISVFIKSLDDELRSAAETALAAVG